MHLLHGSAGTMPAHVCWHLSEEVAHVTFVGRHAVVGALGRHSCCLCSQSVCYGQAQHGIVPSSSVLTMRLSESAPF